MIVGRSLGWVLLFATLVLLGWDGVYSLSSGDWGFAVLGQRWYELDQALGGASLNVLQAGIERRISVSLWDNIFAPLLQWWAWAIFFLPGLILVLACRHWRGERQSRRFSSRGRR